MHVEWCF